MNATLKPQDLAAALAVCVCPDATWSFQSLSDWMGVGRSYLFYALERAAASGLYRAEARAVNRLGLMEFIEHGARWSFYAQLGGRVRGVPTAHSGPVLAAQLASEAAGAVVWPAAAGAVVGQGLDPLYPQAASTVERAPELYTALTLVDAVRLGRRRDSELAVRELRARLEVG